MYTLNELELGLTYVLQVHSQGGTLGIGGILKVGSRRKTGFLLHDVAGCPGEVIGLPGFTLHTCEMRLWHPISLVWCLFIGQGTQRPFGPTIGRQISLNGVMCFAFCLPRTETLGPLHAIAPFHPPLAGEMGASGVHSDSLVTLLLFSSMMMLPLDNSPLQFLSYMPPLAIPHFGFQCGRVEPLWEKGCWSSLVPTSLPSSCRYWMLFNWTKYLPHTKTLTKNFMCLIYLWPLNKYLSKFCVCTATQ